MDSEYVVMFLERTIIYSNVCLLLYISITNSGFDHRNKQLRPPFLYVKYAAHFTNQPNNTTVKIALLLYTTLNRDESTLPGTGSVHL